MYMAFMYVCLGYIVKNMKYIYLYIHLIYICIYLYKNHRVSTYLNTFQITDFHIINSVIYRFSQQIITLAGNHIVIVLHITQQVHCTQFLKQFFIHVVVRLYLQVCSAITKFTRIILSLLVILFKCTLMSECIRSHHKFITEIS